MKILYHHRTQGRGAEGTHIMSIVTAMESMGHEVDILSPPGVDPRQSGGAAPVDKSDVKTGGIQTLWKWVSKHLPDFVFELIEILYNLTAASRLEKKLKTGAYDMVYERYAFYMVIGALKAHKHGVPFVLEANEVSGIPDRARPQIFPRLCGWFERILIKKSGAILPVSSKLKEMLIENGCEKQKIFVTPNAIFEDGMGVDAENVAKLRSKLAIEDKVVIGFAGWFDKWDRLDFLLSVFAQVRESNEKAHLVLIGDGPSLQDLREEADKLGVGEHITLTGAVPRTHIFEYLSLLDVAILPHSNKFGSPVILFELFGLARPVVAPALPPILDVVTDEDIALIFEPLNKEQCVEKLSSLVADEDKRNQLGKSARDATMRKHTWHQNAKKSLEAVGLVSR